MNEIVYPGDFCILYKDTVKEEIVKVIDSDDFFVTIELQNGQMTQVSRMRLTKISKTDYIKVIVGECNKAFKKLNDKMELLKKLTAETYPHSTNNIWLTMGGVKGASTNKILNDIFEENS